MKKIKVLLRLFIIVVSLSFSLTSCEKKDEIETSAPKDIMDVLLADSNFSTLTKLLTDKELIDTLKASGSFTLFAPTNDAFAKIDVSKLTNVDLLRILKTHVLNKKVLAADVTSGFVPSLESSIYLSKNNNGVFINGKSHVTQADISATNGVIHAIDKVIVPPNKKLWNVLTDYDNPNFTEFVSLLFDIHNNNEVFDRVRILVVIDWIMTPPDNGLTIFVPTNEAFKEFYKTIPKAKLIKRENLDLITNILLYHFVEGSLFSSDLPNVKGEVKTLNFTADKLAFDLAGGTKVKGNKSGNSNIKEVNIEGTNGVVHLIDKVLIP